MKVFCCICNKEVDAVETPGHCIYPGCEEFRGRIYLTCPRCSGYVGTHRDGSPLGCIPTPDMRAKRAAIHKRIDAIISQKRLSAHLVYRYLSEKLGYEYHTGNVKTDEEAARVSELLSELFFNLYMEADNE